jgi:hypothetical protein
MKTVLILLSSLILPLNSVAVKEAEPIYSQCYTILLKGSVAGTETVTEHIGDSGNLVSKSEHDIVVSDGFESKRMMFSTEMVLSRKTWSPISYIYKYTSGNTGDSCEVLIEDSAVTRTLRRGGQTSVITAAFNQNTVIVDFNVYHLYDYLVRKYDSKKGGRQVFANFIPVIGNDIALALTLLMEEAPKLGKDTLSFRNFRVELEDLWSATLAVDKNGRVVRLSIPQQNLEVIRTDLLDLNDARN